MSAAVKKLDGIDSVDVSISDKKATIHCKPNSKTSVEQIRQAIAAAGFTPADAEAQIVGTVVERDGKPALQVSGANTVYPMTGDAAALRAAVGKTATVHARVQEAKDKVVSLQVVSISQ